MLTPCGHSISRAGGAIHQPIRNPGPDDRTPTQASHGEDCPQSTVLTRIQCSGGRPSREAGGTTMAAPVHPAAASAPPFLGRDAELADLISTWRGGLSSGRFLLVRGEGGIGKTALIDAAVAQAPKERRVLRGAADAMDHRRAFGVLLDALGPVLTEQDRQVAAEQNEHITGERLLSLLDGMAGEPTVLILEDLHWADDASLHLLTRLARTLGQLPVVVVAALRPQARHEVAPALDRLLGELDDRGLLHAFDLGPLPESSCIAIAESLTGAPIGETFAQYTAAAGGNPLFLTEMVRSLLRDGAVTVDENRAELRDAPLGPSPSLATVMMRHLSRLTPATRELLTTAALLGTRFPAVQLRLVTGRTMRDLVPLLREALAAGFLAEIDESTLGFRHELIQHVLLHDLPAAVRAELHHDVALKLEGAGVPAATVAGHVLRAPSVGEDLPWLQRLAQRTAASAPATAVELWGRVVQGTDPSEPLHVAAVAGLARTALSGGRVHQAYELASAALPHADEPEVAAVLRSIRVRSLVMQHRHAASQRLAQEYAASDALEPAERAAHLAFAGWPTMLLGDMDEALRLAAEGAASAAVGGNPVAEVNALTLQGLILNGRGDLDDAVRVLTRAVELAERHPSVATIETFPHAVLAVALADVDRIDESAAMIRRGLQLSAQLGLRTGILATHAMAAEARSHNSNLADIATELQAHAALLGQMDIGLDPPVLALRARVIALQHGSEAALEVAGLVDPIASRRVWSSRGSALIWLGHVHAVRARGDVSAVLETLWRGWQDVHGLRMLMECTEIALDLAELWQRPAGDERLRGLIDADAAAKAPEVVEATRTVAARNPGVAHLQATALAVAGVADGDAEALLEAERVMSATPRRLDHARIAELAALALPAYSERTRVLAETALHEYQEVGADHEATRARAQFRLLGVKVPGQRRRPASGWGSLTRTEERIAGHVATGETNLEIAQSLFVSRRTVETHVSNILAKLGLRSRTELAIRFAARLDKPGQ